MKPTPIFLTMHQLKKCWEGNLRNLITLLWVHQRNPLGAVDCQTIGIYKMPTLKFANWCLLCGIEPEYH